jgi:hypothetical protein
MESAHLNKVDGEARQILDESGWQWDGWALGFRRLARLRESTETYEQRRRMQPCPDLITIKELETHHLYLEPQDTPIPRHVALSWLHWRIAEAEPQS